MLSKHKVVLSIARFSQESTIFAHDVPHRNYLMVWFTDTSQPTAKGELLL